MPQWTSSIHLDIPVDTSILRRGHPLSLDLYVPERSAAHPAGPGRPPLLIYIHGGGWKEGTNDRPPGFRTILSRGLALASLQYRLSDEASGLEMLADLRRGVQVARDEAARYGADTDTWFLWGISAGGHLVSLLAHRLNDPAVTATAPADRAPEPVPAPIAIAPWCGVFDLSHYQSLEGVREELRETVIEIEGALTGGDPEVRRALSPVTFVGAASRPHFFIHGAEDHLVPPTQSTLMHEALTAAGVRSELLLLPDGDHAMPPGDSPEMHATLEFLLNCANGGKHGV